MRSRDGHSVAELVVALSLTALVCAALARTFSAAESLARQYARTVLAAEAIRIAEAVLGDELRFLDPAADVRAVAEDSIAVRAFRGLAIVCAATGTSVVVRYRGLRAPEPAKDSVLVVDAVGNGHAAPLLWREAAGDACDAKAGESLDRWSLGLAPAPGSLILVFESGSYHLADRALRYRRGDGGRQPLTTELFDVRRSTFGRAPTPPTADATATPAILGTLATLPGAGQESGSPTRAARFRFPMLNARPATAGSTEARP